MPVGVKNAKAGFSQICRGSGGKTASVMFTACADK